MGGYISHQEGGLKPRDGVSSLGQGQRRQQRVGNVLVKRNKKLKGVRRINVSVREGTEGEVKVEEQEYVASAQEDTAGQRGDPAQ